MNNNDIAKSITTISNAFWEKNNKERKEAGLQPPDAAEMALWDNGKALIINILQNLNDIAHAANNLPGNL